MACRTGILVMGCLGLLAACGCQPQTGEKWHQDNLTRWNAFWGVGDGLGARASAKEVWTIECNAYTGPRHRQTSDRLAQALKRVPDLRSERIWVEANEKRSRVFYGEYKLPYVEAKVDRASHKKGDLVIDLSDEIERDLRFIRSLAIGDQYPFFSARPIPKPIEDVGPPEWDLRNARGMYTLNVGVTYATQTLHDYKQAAIEWVKALREDGYEAYYYHDPDRARTSICVGTFDENARTTSGDGHSRYSRAVEALRRQGDFMYNLENGRRMFKKARNSDTGKVERMPNRSFLVEMPQHESGGDAS